MTCYKRMLLEKSNLEQDLFKEVSLALGEFGAIYHVLSNIKELNLIRLYQITHFLDGWILEKLHYLCGKGVF